MVSPVGPSRSRKPRLVGENDEEGIGSDEDEELDSDEAFEESDEERFAGFSWGGKKVHVTSLFPAYFQC